jgi:hypothetical protein
LLAIATVPPQLSRRRFLRNAKKSATAMSAGGNPALPAIARPKY